MSAEGSPLVPLETIQLVYGSLTVGLVVFVGIVPFLAEQTFDAAGIASTSPIWLVAMVGFVLVIVAAVSTVGRAMIHRARAEVRGLPAPQRGDLLRLYLPYVLVRGALIEGLGFFGAAVFLVSGLGLGLVVAAGAIAGLLLTFPTRDRFRGYRDRLTGGPI